jgi:hypothetical protein
MSGRLRRVAGGGAVALLAYAALGVGPAGGAPLAGSQGTDTALPLTASHVTVNGRGAFASLAITVNQTAELTDQAVSVTWTGGVPTVTGPGRFAGNFLQIMQCWGDDDGSQPGNPGPPPEQCEQGAVTGVVGGLPPERYPNRFATTRIISRHSPDGAEDWDNYAPGVGVVDSSTNVWLPFRSVGGTSYDIQDDATFNPSAGGGDFWMNRSYDRFTTNEIAGAASGPDGAGAELFEVQTAKEASGLGCGKATQPDGAGGKVIPKCWLVVVPRGSAVEENVGTPWEGSAENGVVTSPVAPAAWEHRIAIPLAFNPVDTPCALGSAERRISGTELAAGAVHSWQPLLCSAQGLPPFNYSAVNDATARQQLQSKSANAQGMVVVSEPLAASAVTAANPVVYAPLSASGLVIGFNIERNPGLDATADERLLAGVRVADLNLTPRLVAKLLTQSYRQAVSIIVAPPYPWLATNPLHMGLDPDFLRFNPEFTLLQIADSRTFSTLELPLGNWDYARQLWAWVLADPEAKAWMDGQPDQWGMKVNPVYATTAGANSTGFAFASPLPTSFVKADPYCYQDPPRGPGNAVVPSALCGTDWVPYSTSLAATARITRLASDGAKIVADPFAVVSSRAWVSTDPLYLGTRAMLSITDTPSAAQYGVQAAHLSRAGDDGEGREFVAADHAGLTAGVAALVPSDVPGVLLPAPTAVAPHAYPLTTLTYAAIAPLALDATARGQYASFLDYVAGPGQVAGLALGQLPRGYVPLDDALRAETVAAAVQVRTFVAPPATTTTTTTTSPPATTDTAATEPATTEPATPAPATPDASPDTPARDDTPSGAPAVPRPTGTTRPRSTATTAVPTTTTTAASPTTAAAPDTTAGPTTVPPARPGTTPSTATTTTTTPGTTPRTGLAGSRYAVPSLGVLALGSGLGALEIAKRPRRGTADGAIDDVGGPDPDGEQDPDAGLGAGGDPGPNDHGANAGLGDDSASSGSIGAVT